MANEITQENVIDWDEKKGKVPSMLNVLTILTFIGSGIALISSIYAYISAQKNYDSMADLIGKMDSAPDAVKKMMGPNPMEMARKSLENKMPILLLSLVAVGLCVYGAIQMRKLQKTGFWVYVIGEVLPVIAMFLFIGIGLISSFTLMISLAIPIIFIILYATQLKYLK